MSATRRKFFQDTAIFCAGLFGMGAPLQAQQKTSQPGAPPNPHSHHAASHATTAPQSSAAPPVPMVAPDVPNLPYELDGAVKVFKLTAEPVKRKIAPFKTVDVWGYNGSCPGPTIQIQQGDRMRIIFENHLPESTSIHWHGLEIPIDQDGVPWITQKPVPPGGKHVYEFTVHQEGTFFYHSHGAMQEMMGQIGFLIAHPASPYHPHADHDFGIILQEWAVLPSNTVPNSASMEYNWLTFNGLSAPAITPMIARLGSRVRLRVVNLGMDHHPIHLHGNQFVMTGTEGGRAPETAWYPMNTILVAVAQARVVEFDAKYPGDWMLHCHLPHHMMNSMMDLLRDRQIETASQADAKAMSQMQTLANTVGFEHVHHSPIAENAAAVPGFPQDAFMEMGMDEVVAKPETHGLPPNWSAQMMGMMTLIRVLPDKQYDEIMQMKKSGMPAEKHEHNHNS